jgi:pyrroline-5-carboxylate reductase
MTTRRVAVIGAGRMGETLIQALVASGAVPPDRIIATGRRGDRLQEVGEMLGVETTLDNREACRRSSLVLLCVKPQGAAEVLAELDEVLTEQHLLVSILAGVATHRLEKHLSRPVPVVRAMPNTPSLIGAGMTALCAGRAATREHVQEAVAIFDRVGRTVVLEEHYFDAVTGLSASGPAFIYIVIEALAEGGVKVGLPRSIATELAAQTCLGAARMVIETEQHPAVLKDAVTTPAGCTIDGILKLEEGGLRVTLIKAIVEAAARSRELVP